MQYISELLREFGENRVAAVRKKYWRDIKNGKSDG
jgi:hypothetical protein